MENRFPPWDTARGAPDGIIVLGGAIRSRQIRSTAVSRRSSVRRARLIAIAKLARQFPAARIIYSRRQRGRLFPASRPEADFVYPLLDNLGVPRERVMLENRSRNTAENALFSKAIANPKPGERWLLVTSAMHMPRAIGCFRRVGFAVEAYPVDWRTLRRPGFIPLSPVRQFGARR